jgi:hypothetical protein
LRLIGQGLHAGVLEAGALSYPDKGTPQGGVVTLPTKLQAFFFGVRFPSESIHPKDHLHLV